tara:strand:+ start:102865 stop:103572 length:708 start_codon:yes stop_codon:yes gene_type:complete
MGCSHTVDFRSSHFAVPHVADEQWQGQVAFSSAQPTEITLIADKESNPPDRTIDINDDTSEEGFFETLFVLDTFGLETDLTLFPQVELYLYGTSNFGLRWQFLGHGNGAGKWVASIQGAYGTWNDESGTEAELDFADTQVTTSELGLSIGYKFERAIVYISGIQNTHTTETEVINSHGTFGPYEDEGIHTTVSLGVSTYGPGFLLGLEYNAINIEWNESLEDTQETLGLRLGFGW